MQCRIQTYLLTLLLLLVVAPALAQERVVKLDTLSHEVHFRWDRSMLDTMYMGNNRVFEQMAHEIDSIGVENINSVVIVSQSSPEGPFARNQNLSNRRAATMHSYMERHHPEVDSLLKVVPEGESWQQLRLHVVNDNQLNEESKERILSIIDDNALPIEVKKYRLSKDKAYSYLYKTYYPRIRNSRIEIVYNKYFYRYLPIAGDLQPTFERRIDLCSAILAMPTIPATPAISATPATPATPAISATPATPATPAISATPATPSIHKPKIQMRDTLVFAAKTNLLYDAVTALNFEVEVPIGRHWSVAVEDVFPWWEKDNKYCFQMWEMGAEARYWFRNNEHKREKLRGHFLGAYAMSAKFDFQNDYKLCYQGEYWSAGLTYGYAIKLSHHLNMEFSISVGWLSSAYRHYYPADDYELLWRDKSKVGRIGYFGPTKLKVALVCPIRIPYKKRGGSL